jgi:CheY-like chemotaxis protein
VANILLVEDTDIVRFALSTLLKASGHRVTEACDGIAAMIAIQDVRFDIVVTDVFMPAMDGIELIRQLRDSHPDVKIVAISGGGAGQLADLVIGIASKLGADVTLQKPVDNETFLANIDALTQSAT